MARPTLLSDAVMQSIADFVASGGRPERVRISTRSVRRWRAQGRPELDALSLEARLVLALDRAEEEVRALSWQETARRLDEESGEDWMPIDFELEHALRALSHRSRQERTRRTRGGLTPCG